MQVLRVVQQSVILGFKRGIPERILRKCSEFLDSGIPCMYMRSRVQCTSLHVHVPLAKFSNRFLTLLTNVICLVRSANTGTSLAIPPPPALSTPELK